MRAECRRLNAMSHGNAHRAFSSMAYPNPSKGPLMNELKKSLSHLMCTFLHPILDTNSIVCWGVKASMAVNEMVQ